MFPLPTSPQVLAIVSALIEEKTGIHYPAEDRELLADKVGLRAQAAGFESLLDYYYFLRYDDGSAAELDALIDALVVNETYFFRELEPLNVLVQDFLAPMVSAGRRPRVWSAASATGEEPLTLAMLLDEAGLLPHVSILASDISPRALARARSGRHGRRSLRASPPAALAARYLQPESDGYRSDPRLHAAVTFQRVNLTDRAAIAGLGRFDVILCRNVLIYFRDETAISVLGSLVGALHDGGRLIVGISESLMRFGTSLMCDEHRGVFVYRKA